MASYFVTFVGLLMQALYYAIFGRIILTWIDQGGRWPITRILHDVTEPILGPIRRVVPAMGMLDLSPMIAIILLTLVRSALSQP